MARHEKVIDRFSNKQLDSICLADKQTKTAKELLKITLSSLKLLIKHRQEYSVSEYDRQISKFWNTYHLVRNAIIRSDLITKKAKENLDYVYNPNCFTA
jgi:hypothetical protein